MIQRLRALALTWMCALCLIGCLVPEKFTASIVVNPDATYVYRYEGTAVSFLAAMAMKDKGALTAKDEAKLREDAAQTAKRPGVARFEYLGNGRYALKTEETLQLGQQPSRGIELVRYSRDAKTGVYSVTQPDFKAKEIDEMKAMGIPAPKGVVEISLPKTAKVISHNADSEPGWFSSTYTFKVDGPAAKRSIQFTMK